MSKAYHRIGCGGQCPVNGLDDSAIGFIPNKNKLISVNSSVKVAKGLKKKYDTGIVYLSPYWSFDGSNNLCPSASAGCRSTCLVTSGQLKNPTPKQSQLDKTNFWLSDPNGFLSQAHKEIELLVRNHAKPNSNKFCIRLNGTSDIPFETKSYTYKGVRHKSIMEAFPNVQFYDYTKIYGRLGKTPKNYHLTFSASEVNTALWKKALERGFQVAMVFGAQPGKVSKKTGEYIKKPDPLPKSYNGYQVIDGDDTDLTFTRPNGVIIGLRMKGKAENDVTGFVKRDYPQANKNYPKLNPKTNIPNIISPRSSKPFKPHVSRVGYLNQYPVQKEIVVGSIGAAETLQDLTPEVKVSVIRSSNAEKKITNSKTCADIFRQYIGKLKVETQELFAVMYLKNNNGVIGVYNHSKGGTNATIADVKLVLAGALNLMATNIILCHNHPSGSLIPSDADIDLTKKIKQAASVHDMRVLDHIILTRNDYYSFADEGII